MADRRPFDAWRRQVGAKVADKITADAKALGTEVHALANLLARDKTAPVKSHLEPYADAIKEFHALHIRRILKTEATLVSKEDGFGGTLDLYCELVDGARAVVDYKVTSGNLTREHGLQTAAYAILLKRHGYAVNRRIVVRLRKDVPGKWYARSYREHESDVEAFRACVTLWTWMHRNKLLKAVA